MTTALITPGNEAIALVDAITGEPVSPEEIKEAVETANNYVGDDILVFAVESNILGSEDVDIVTISTTTTLRHGVDKNIVEEAFEELNSVFIDFDFEEEVLDDDILEAIASDTWNTDDSEDDLDEEDDDADDEDY